MSSHLPMPKLRFELHAKTRGFLHKVDAAKRVIEAALAQMEAPYIAFSAGKDSTVVLHLVRSLAPDTVAVWSDDEWNLPETMTLVEATPNLHRIAARVQHAEWFISWEDGAGRVPEGTIWVDAFANDGLQTYAHQQGFDGVFIGLREEENSRRRIHLRTYGQFYFAANHGVWQCNPIAKWTVTDVWAYIHSNGIPYNTAYDKLTAMGVPLPRQRLGPLAQWRAMGYGQITLLKRGWPDLYNRFAERYPEASAYV